MAAITATSWDAAPAVVILQPARPWGPHGQRRTLVQLNLQPSNFTAGDTYPSDGIPAPAAARVGFREAIHYIIPLSPFMHVAGNGPTTFTAKVFPWGCFPPTYGASGVTGTSVNHIRLVGGVPVATAAAGANPSFVGKSFLNELTTNAVATDLVSDGDALTAYAIFVGK